MRRYALGDDQWDRIKDFLPGREGLVTDAVSNRLRLMLRGLIPNRHDDARISTITSFLGCVGNHGICLYDHSRVDAVEPCINLRFDGARAGVHEDFYFHWLWHPTAFRWFDD